MDLSLDRGLAEGYRSRAQVARVVTEDWVSRELYCPSCESDSLAPSAPGTQVVDFTCNLCPELFQLKSQSRPFGSRVLDSAYRPMVDRIVGSRAPSFLFLRYGPTDWRVHDLFIVPRHFLSLSAVERRPPLSTSARRSGWVGCNILLSALPEDARISVVQGGTPRPEEEVRRAWRAFSFLKYVTPESRGWMADILACVRELGKAEFTLADLYRFEGRLGAMHPHNRNVRPKIRQQLQVLRDHGFLDFRGNGSYRLLVQTKL